jgi:ATP-dependent DNA helicase RecG
MRSAADLLDELNAVDESTRIEAKRASDVGKSILETVIAFANEPGLGGGYLLLGVDWSINDKGDTVYRAVGLPNPDKVQRDLASQCASTLNVVVRPEIQLEQVDDHTLLVVYVPECTSPSVRPRGGCHPQTCLQESDRTAQWRVAAHRLQRPALRG